MAKEEKDSKFETLAATTDFGADLETSSEKPAGAPADVLETVSVKEEPGNNKKKKLFNLILIVIGAVLVVGVVAWKVLPMVMKKKPSATPPVATAPKQDPAKTDAPAPTPVPGAPEVNPGAAPKADVANLDNKTENQKTAADFLASSQPVPPTPEATPAPLPLPLPMPVPAPVPGTPETNPVPVPSPVAIPVPTPVPSPSPVAVPVPAPVPTNQAQNTPAPIPAPVPVPAPVQPMGNSDNSSNNSLVAELRNLINEKFGSLETNNNNLNNRVGVIETTVSEIQQKVAKLEGAPRARPQPSVKSNDTSDEKPVKKVVKKSKPAKDDVKSEAKVDSTAYGGNLNLASNEELLFDKRVKRPTESPVEVKVSKPSYVIHSIYAGRVWIRNPDGTHSTFVEGDKLPTGEVIKKIDMEKEEIVTSKGVLKP